MVLSDLSVFVYGTLKPGGRYWPEFCEGKVAQPIPARIRGKLYDLHLGYPGLKLKGDGWVHGYVLTFGNQNDFLRLDELEGYVPGRPEEQNEYIRLRVPVFSCHGQQIGEVWTYEITETTMAGCRSTFLPDGDWPIGRSA